MAFRRGGKAAEEDNQNLSSGRRLQYWNIDEDESEILRFLGDYDDWWVIKQHRFFPTKPAPKDAKKWPQKMTAICRKDPAFADEYSSCPLCDAVKDYDLRGYGGKKPATTTSMVFTSAVRREKVECDGSEAMGGSKLKGKKILVDRQVELDVLDNENKPTGEKRTVPDIRIVSNTYYSLFGALATAWDNYDSLLDRDFVLTRKKAGNGTGTVHVVNGLDKIESLQPGTERWKVYTEALDFYGLDFEDLFTRQASDEFYDRFFLDDNGKAIVPESEWGENADRSKSSGNFDVSDSVTVDDDDEDYAAELARVKSRLNKSTADLD